MSKIDKEDPPFFRSTRTRKSPTRTILTRSHARLGSLTDISARPSANEEAENQAREPRKNKTHRAESETSIPDLLSREEETSVVHTPILKQISTTIRKEDTPTQTTTINIKMDQLKIQQNIVSIVKEFSGEDGSNVTNELTKFLDAADLVYDTLGTNDEKEIFTKLIKFRLNGDAYARVNSRQIDTYEDFKKILHGTFLKTYSINELEKKLVETKQNYGESIRNYGYRLTETLEEYKEGYRQKYALKKIDDTYNRHLDDSSVQIFKRGLNNIILREKVATIKAKDIKEIMEEAMETERMLAATVDMPIIQSHFPLQNQQSSMKQQTNIQTNLPVICNYCNIPNHTWDKCQRRLSNERYTYSNSPNIYNPNPNINSRQTQNSYTRQQNFYTPPHNPIPRNPYHQNQQRVEPFTQNRFNNNISPNNTHFQQRNQNFTPQRQFEDFRNRPPKYCSYCKITKGHTFDECRSRQRDSLNGNKFNNSQPTTNNSGLEEKFRNMKINTIRVQQPTDQDEQQEFSQQSGNERGLAEM